MKLKEIKAAPGRLPVKRSINLATVDEHKLSIPVSLGGVVVVVLAVVLLSKIFVINRFAELSRYQGEASDLSNQVDQCYARLEELAGVENEYAHYTLEAMTEEELTRCDRVDVLEMMQEKVLGDHGTIGWSVSGNILTLQITGESLQSINLLSQDIEQSPIVDFCTVSSAHKGVNTRKVNPDGSIVYDEEEIVTASINVFLQRDDHLITETNTVEETAGVETTGE